MKLYVLAWGFPVKLVSPYEIICFSMGIPCEIMSRFGKVIPYETMSGLSKVIPA